MQSVVAYANHNEKSKQKKIKVDSIESKSYLENKMESAAVYYILI